MLISWQNMVHLVDVIFSDSYFNVLQVEYCDCYILRSYCHLVNVNNF